MERAFKYQGLGNDFVILDRRSSGRDIGPEAARALCNRHTGVGADGVLVLLPAPGALARMVVHNADGSVAEMCGNGIRCVAKYLAEQDGAREPVARIATGAGVRECALRFSGSEVQDVEVEMGPAAFAARNLPGGEAGPAFVNAPLPQYAGWVGTAVSMGNPHLVLFDRPLEEAGSSGPALERHPAFPERTNVEWVLPAGDGFRVAVWERGAGLTQACGTGACAVAAAALRTGRAQAERWIPVQLPGGGLEVRVASDYASVRLRGPATFVFEAKIPDPSH